MKYCIVIPAHNEQDFIALTLDSILSQTLLPQKVIIVNDNSTDDTENIIDSYISKNDFFQKLNTVSSTAHMPGSKVINAFNKGFDVLDVDYNFIVKLDADIILPNNYFESISQIFVKNSKVGIAGGFAYEKNDSQEWLLNHPMNKDHVRGAFKAYSKDCFKAIGGLKSAMGWDTIDELLAQFHGFKITTDETLKVKHLRPTGNAYNKKARILQGKAMYTMNYGFLITTIASLKMALKHKNLRVFFNNMEGFYKAKKDNTPFLVTREESTFIRKLRWQGILKKLF